MEKKEMPIVVNMFASPGSGKSTMAALVFSRLKMLNINCELVTEFAKDKVWENNNTALANQLYVFAKQYYRVDRCADKVDVIITDSPLALSPMYNKDPDIHEPLKQLALKIANKYSNLNYFIRRIKKYNPVGRLQTEAESDEIAVKLRDAMDANGIKYTAIDGDLMSADIIVNDILKIINPNKSE